MSTATNQLHRGRPSAAFPPPADGEPAEVIHLNRARLAAAAALPSLRDGAAFGGGERYLKQRRPGGKWIVFENGVYLISTKTKDRKKAEHFLDLLNLQDEAARVGIFDVRGADVIRICDAFEKAPGVSANVNKQNRYRLARLRPYLQGLKVRDLDDDWLIRTTAALKATIPGNVGARKGRDRRRIPEPGEQRRLKDGSIEGSLQTLRWAIRYWCRKKQLPLVIPFEAPPRTPGRDRLLTAEEQAILLRWADGEESYDPRTKTWSPPKRPLNGQERHSRRMFGRLLRLGLATGSRPGRLEGLAWWPSQSAGHIDIEIGTLFRLPVSGAKGKVKHAPPVVLSPALMAFVLQWKAEDGDEIYLIRKFRDRQPARRAAAQLFDRVVRKLGIVGLTRHVLRHTAISGMVAQGVPASVISAVVGISLQVLKERYDHSDDRAVQPLAHPQLDRLLVAGMMIVP